MLKPFCASLFVLAAFGCRDTPSTSIVIMPRANALSAEEAQSIQGFGYSPRDMALGWHGSDSIVVGHAELFAANDVVASTCAGTGVFVVPFVNGGVARPVRVGQPLCEALRGPYEDIALLPDASRMVYSRPVATNSSQLLSHDLRQNSTRVISMDCFPYAREPAISSDGSSLALSGLCEGRDQQEWAVYIASIDGAGRRRAIGGDSISAVMPAWSPDGRSLVIRLGDDTAPPQVQRLAVVDVQSRAIRVLVAGSFPSWSPDGRWIAYVHRDSVAHDDTEVRLVRPDSSEMRTVFRNQTQTTYVRGFGPMREGMVRPPLLWTADSHGIVFGRAFERGISLWHVSIDAPQPRQVTEAAQR